VANDAVDMARRDLASRLGIAESQITTERVEEVDWRDTSLGCPQPGRMYAQVITPGYRIILQANGKTYEYHSDQRGNVVFCATPSE